MNRAGPRKFPYGLPCPAINSGIAPARPPFSLMLKTPSFPMEVTTTMCVISFQWNLKGVGQGQKMQETPLPHQNFGIGRKTRGLRGRDDRHIPDGEDREGTGFVLDTIFTGLPVRCGKPEGVATLPVLDTAGRRRPGIGRLG